MATGTGLVGTTVLHYHIVERLGGGGMGEVYLAEDQRLGRRVALKFLAASVDRDGEARERLIREAQAAALLRSPHIEVTYDLAEYEGSLFIAMEYVEGDTLSSRIASGNGAWRSMNPRMLAESFGSPSWANRSAKWCTVGSMGGSLGQRRARSVEDAPPGDQRGVIAAPGRAAAASMASAGVAARS